MNNPYNPEFNYLFLNDLNKEVIQNKDQKAQAQICKLKKIMITNKFRDTFLNNWKEKVKDQSFDRV